MNKPSFVYVTYIAATPEKVWDALTNGELTKQYWGRRVNASDWKVGSRWEHRDYDDATLVDVVGKVVEVTPPHRLVTTWASPADAGNEAKHSRVTFQIESFPDTVRLTVTHEDLDDAAMLQGISKGWPTVLSSLKTLLETGRPLAVTTQRTGWPE